ncbi:MAG: inorganic phosphate transporter [Parvibaculum sp.]
MEFVVFLVVVAIAYANGANDSFKGVATLYGGGASSYRTALLWAVLTTLAGSLFAGVFAEALVKTFSGAGLVPDAVLSDPAFMVSVALGAAITVFLTALFGIPISTTHALTGALVGAALFNSGSSVDFHVLEGKFLLPLAVSPLLAIALILLLFPLLRMVARRLGLTQTSCVCVSAVEAPLLAGTSHSDATLSTNRELVVVQGDTISCMPGSVAAPTLKIELGPILRKLHFLSAGAVSFARGTNDTPKIVGIAMLSQAFDLKLNIFIIAVAMAIGGLLHSRKIAETMSSRILSFDEAEGTIANLVTSFLVIVASRLGLPVSTTHVAVSSLFGLGAVKGNAHWSIVGGIALSWLLTLPIAGILAALLFATLR